MQSPFVVGLLSIIPGLGFFVLGQPKRGIGIIGIVGGLFLLANFFSIDFFSDLSIIAWIGQIYYAVQTANLLKRQKSGEVVIPRETTPIPPPPHGLSANERMAHKMRETVRQQLNLGEHLTDAVVAQTMPSIGSTVFSVRMYYVGLTEKALVIIEQDFMGKPADVKRIPLSEIKSSEYKKGLLTDSLVLDFGNKKSMRLQVTIRLRTQTQTIFAGLQKQNAG